MKPLRIAAVLLAALCALPAHAQGELFVKQMQLDPNVPRTPPPADPGAFQRQLIETMMQVGNRKRAEAGLPPLGWDPVLAAAADRYARKMRDFQFFTHTTPAGQTLATRLPQDVLQRYAKLGENLWSAKGAVNWNAGWLAEEAAANWVESRTHRTNLLEPAFTQAGIGVAFSVERGVFISMMFGRPQTAGPTVADLQAKEDADLYGFVQRLPGEVVVALNSDRAQRGAQPMRTDDTLSRIALRHSESMLDVGTFSERDASGVSVLDRAVEATRGQYRRMAVGLWHGAGGLEFMPRSVAASALETWRQKAGNASDMLDPGFDIVGVGVATNGNRVLITTLYAETGGPVRASTQAPQPLYITQ